MSSAIEWFRLLRGQLEHEDQLLTQRLNWFILSQSFLFTAYAIVTREQIVRASDHVVRLVVLIPTVALCTSTVIFVSIVAGLLTMRRIRHEFAARATAARDEALPPLHGRGHLRMLGMLAPTALPLVFCAVWLMLLIGVLGYSPSAN